MTSPTAGRSRPRSGNRPPAFRRSPSPQDGPPFDLARGARSPVAIARSVLERGLPSTRCSASTFRRCSQGPEDHPPGPAGLSRVHRQARRPAREDLLLDRGQALRLARRSKVRPRRRRRGLCLGHAALDRPHEPRCARRGTRVVGDRAEVSRATPAAGSVSRERMIEKLVARGTRRPGPDAMRRILRYLSPGPRRQGLQRQRPPHRERQTISQPWSSPACPSSPGRRGHRVPAIGTGSGYQAPSLRLARHVYSVSGSRRLRAAQVRDLSIANVSVKAFTAPAARASGPRIRHRRDRCRRSAPPRSSTSSPRGTVGDPARRRTEQVLVRIRFRSGFEPESTRRFSLSCLGCYG
jgi:hypothetical protein